MALDQLNYGLERHNTPIAAEAERAIATERQRAAVRNDNVERVTYGQHTVEVPKIDHAALGRPVDKQYERNLASVESRLRSIGVSTAVVVNFLPIQLRSDSTLEPLRKAIIPAPKDGQPYTTYAFDDAFIEPARMGADSPLLAFEHHPIELAQEFSRVNPKGVFSFIGIPSDIESERWLATKSTEAQHHGMTYGGALKAKQEEAVDWMHEMLRRGNDNDRLKLMTTEPQKASARRLAHLGFIKEMPTWVERQRDTSVKIPTCPSCQRPSEPGAASCTSMNCAYIIDPRKAYEIGAIPEDHPSLERLTRDEVKEMGISDYVAETREEKKVRTEEGGQKPKSMVALRMMHTQDEMDSIQRKHSANALAEALARNTKADKPEVESKTKADKTKEKE